MCSAWIEKRGGSANVSQIYYARQDLVTEEIAYMAKWENLPELLVMEEVARGLMIIPANINHTNLEPMAIGIARKCKVNANIGASPNASDHSEALGEAGVGGEVQRLLLLLQNSSTGLIYQTFQNLNYNV